MKANLKLDCIFKEKTMGNQVKDKDEKPYIPNDLTPFAPH